MTISKELQEAIVNLMATINLRRFSDCRNNHVTQLEIAAALEAEMTIDFIGGLIEYYRMDELIQNEVSHGE